MERLSCRYPVGRLAGDYARSAAGTALTAWPASQLPADGVGFWILLALACLFLGLAGHTVRRQVTRIVVTDEAIESLPGRRTIRWQSVREIKLAYFSTRTDRKNGWMQLTVDAGSRKLRIDSRIENFQVIAQWALASIDESTVRLSETTSSNLAALGVAPVSLDNT